MKNITHTAKKVWKFLWESESVISWIACFIIAFLIIKFVFLPLLGLILATPMSLVIVESSSMEHQGNFDYFWNMKGAWYENSGINETQFSKFSFQNGLNKGDIVVLSGKKDYNIGDVIVFSVASQKTPIIHRIIEINDGIYSTKGDNNAYQIPQDMDIKKEQIISHAIGRIPMLGWVKLFFTEAFKSLGF